jgi:hypothetical protein
MIWFKEKKSKATRMAILKECYQGREDHVELWGTKSEKEDSQEFRMGYGAVGRGEWKGILTRELERVILGQCEREKYLDFMRDQVWKMDPNYVSTWDELRERLEKQHCNTAVWDVDEHTAKYGYWDPWAPYAHMKLEGVKVPPRKTPYVRSQNKISRKMLEC